ADLGHLQSSDLLNRPQTPRVCSPIASRAPVGTGSQTSCRPWVGSSTACRAVRRPPWCGSTEAWHRSASQSAPHGPSPVPATMGALAVITIGIDPHKASITAVAIDPSGRSLGHRRLLVNAGTLNQLMAWAAGWPARRFAVEGAYGLGRPIAQQLAAASEQV